MSVITDIYRFVMFLLGLEKLHLGLISFMYLGFRFNVNSFRLLLSHVHYAIFFFMVFHCNEFVNEAELINNLINHSQYE